MGEMAGERGLWRILAHFHTALYGSYMTTTKGAEEARKQLPDLLDAAEAGEATVIIRHGRPVAALVPTSTYKDTARQESILDLKGSGRGMWGKDSRRFLRNLRDEWDRPLPNPPLPGRNFSE